MSHDRLVDGDSIPDRAERLRAPHSPIDDDVDRIAPVVDDGDRPEQTEDSTIDMHDSSSAERQLVSKPSKDANAVKESALPTLRYRRTSLWLLACYVPFLVLPWILICIMAVRPPSLPSYYNQEGEYCEDAYLTMAFWFAFVRILNSIASVLVVPITSALLAQGAVVYTQRRRSGQKLNLRQTFALSDRGWSDLPMLWSAYREKGTQSQYLTAGAWLLALSVIQAPVQQAMISYEVIYIMTCADLPVGDLLPPILGYDPEPNALAMVPQIMVIPDLINSLATVTDMDMQTYLWRDTATDWSAIAIGGNDNAMGSTFFVPYTFDQKLRYFVSAFPNNTDTGVLREHVMRLNSSAECQSIDISAYPQTCDGLDPFMAYYRSPQYEKILGYGNFSIDVCVPGDQSASPWTLSRDRQDIYEDLYIKVHVDNETNQHLGFVEYGELGSNVTIHCTANTTRGYFELPNFRNGFTTGPLLQKWPDEQTLWKEFNDYLNTNDGSLQVPSTWDTFAVADPELAGDWRLPIDPFGREMRPTPGPLMTSALAMFGKDSFFYVASNITATSYPPATQQICQAGNIPFLRLNGFVSELYNYIFSACFDINNPYNEGFEPSLLDSMLYEWVLTFFPQKYYTSATSDAHTYSTEALEVAMFFANQHLLTETATATKSFYSARNIFTSPGSLIPRPVVPLYAKITVSILMTLQLLGLVLLAKYIYSVPTWTERLDSCAIAQLTHDVDASIFLTIKKPTEKDLEKLKKCNALVGIAEENHERNVELLLDEQQAAPNVDAIDAASSQSNEEDLHAKAVSTEVNGNVKMVIGGTGFVTRHHGSFKEWTPKLKFKRRKATKDSLLEKGNN